MTAPSHRPPPLAGRHVEIGRCQVCAGEHRRTMFEEPPYALLRCLTCGFVYVTPRLSDEDLPSVYGEDYWQSDSPRTKGYADYAADEELYLKTFRRRLRLVRRLIGHDPARVLDVGCAAGYFLRVMREQGHDVWGTELSRPIVDVARSHLPAENGNERVHLGTLHDAPGVDGEDGPYQPRSFDLVTLWDVIEHVADPQELLHQCRALLRPGGTLLLETQNVDSLWARLTGRKWQHFKHEEHIYHFTPETIVRILEDCGYDVLHETARFGGKYVSCSFIAERAWRIHPLMGMLFKPMAFGGGVNFYLNLRDELVIAARPRPNS